MPYSSMKSLLNERIFEMTYFSGHMHFKLIILLRIVIDLLKFSTENIVIHQDRDTLAGLEHFHLIFLSFQEIQFNLLLEQAKLFGCHSGSTKCKELIII